jgi:NDP-sugar pyrophosphorylase family protein
MSTTTLETCQLMSAADNLCAVVLAAGAGTRLRPLTLLRPKALCPVGNVPLLDLALDRVAALGPAGPGTVAVNASYRAGQVVAHLGDRVHVSVEPDGPLGTAGGVGRLRDWIDGRPVLVGNADAYLAGGALETLLAGWDGRTVRLLGVPGEPGEVGTFAGRRFAGFSLLPWRWIRRLSGQPGELVRAVWRPAEAAGALEVVVFDGYFRDTGTAAGYLAANLHAAAAAGGRGGNLIADDAAVTARCESSVVGAGAVVRGRLTRSVVWPGCTVRAEEHLTDSIRACPGRPVTTRTRPSGRSRAGSAQPSVSGAT